MENKKQENIQLFSSFYSMKICNTYHFKSLSFWVPGCQMNPSESALSSQQVYKKGSIHFIDWMKYIFPINSKIWLNRNKTALSEINHFPRRHNIDADATSLTFRSQSIPNNLYGYLAWSFKHHFRIMRVTMQTNRLSEYRNPTIIIQLCQLNQGNGAYARVSPHGCAQSTISGFTVVRPRM